MRSLAHMNVKWLEAIKEVREGGVPGEGGRTSEDAGFDTDAVTVRQNDAGNKYRQ